MAKNYQISANQLHAGVRVFLRGTLNYSRLTALIQGAELAAVEARKMQNGMNPVGKPHTTITVNNVTVLSMPNAAKTVEEQFIEERLYDSMKHPEQGKSYNIDNKSPNLPIIMIPKVKDNGDLDLDANGNMQLVQDHSGQELNRGLDVTLVLRCFKPKNFANHGFALEQVIVNEKPVYYSGASIPKDELAARGMVFAEQPRAVQAQVQTDAEAAAAPAVDGTYTNAQGFTLPAPGGATPAVAAAPVQPVAQSQPVAAPAAQAPAPVQQPVAAPAPAQPVQQAPVAAAPTAVPAASAPNSVADLEAEIKRLQALQNQGSAVQAGPQAGINYNG